jgi:hypothetical protein
VPVAAQGKDEQMNDVTWFELRTTVTRPDGSVHANSCHRRFRDFDEVNNDLRSSFKGHQLLSNVPCMPRKELKILADHKVGGGGVRVRVSRPQGRRRRGEGARCRCEVRVCGQGQPTQSTITHPPTTLQPPPAPAPAAPQDPAFIEERREGLDAFVRKVCYSVVRGPRRLRAQGVL